MGSRWAFALGAVTLFVRAGVVNAQDKSGDAQARFVEGVKAYDRRDFEQARLSFLQSLALVRRGSVLRNLGLAEMELGRPVDALHHLREALELPDLDPKRRRVTENDIREAYAATGHIRVETREGATLTIDGQAIDEKAPFKKPVDVLPGKHALEGSFQGRTAQAEVDAQAGEIVAANLPIGPAAPAPSAEPFTSPSPAVLFPRPETRRSPELPMPPGSPFWNVRREVGAGLAAAGLLSTVVGVYFYTQALDAQSRANAARAGLAPWSCSGPMQPPACGTANDAWSTQSTDATLNYVFLGVGIASALAGAAMLLWPTSSSSVAVRTAVTSHGGSLDLRGEF